MKIQVTILTALVTASLLAADASARIWTNAEGKQIDAELVRQVGDTVFLRMNGNGRIYQLNVSTLSQADQDFLASGAGKADEPTYDPADLPEHLADIHDNLVDASGKSLDYPDIGENEYVLFYYSAHWCGPCRRFTPQLVDFYNQKKDGHNFEIIFVSSDRGDDEMEHYMEEAKMPWPAIKHRKVKDSNARRFAGRGIPCLVMLDQKGKVVSHSYVDGQYVGPSKVLRDLQSEL